MKSRRELLAQAERAWPLFLRSLVTGEVFFPLSARIGKTRLAADYAARRAELAAFRSDAETLGLTVRWEESAHRRFDAHELPKDAAWENEEAYVSALGWQAEVRAFREDVALFPPVLCAWAAGNSLEIVAHHGDWHALLRVTAWFLANPRSGLYLRQIPVEGVDTKFFEARLKLLDSLLTACGASATEGTATFEERHGLRRDEPLIRLRFLDGALQISRGFPISDLSVPAPAFRALALAGSDVIVTENLKNFLALPPVENGIAVFGAGNAVPLLDGAAWLQESRIFYWGDLDVDGFAILMRMRAIAPHTRSLLMDLDVLQKWRLLAVPCAISARELEATTLSQNERETLRLVRSESLRLEQERIPFDVVKTALRDAGLRC